ncbi:hypothetical protein FNV43_RR18167 [Rhamnella rubrinervis]|uniref:Anthocyanidin reductase n=1 Tax=Rhamnella rubrinervis TaxID=2594499 RepID=A0A8K0E5B1_9ROSA|nr:hypothetical protein FNV43_RR18167 [Rhamnella rubrinervis]
MTFGHITYPYDNHNACDCRTPLVFLMKYGDHDVETLYLCYEQSKVKLLKSLPGADTELVLFKADIYNPNEFRHGIQGCHSVFHVATPMQHTHNSQIRNSESVRRLIYTASVVAASPLKEDGTGFKDLMDETCWTSLNLSFAYANSSLTAYVDSKTLGEKEILKHGNQILEVIENHTVCVTGGSSYLGSCLVRRHLAKGYTVHATLENLGDPRKAGLLKGFNAQRKLKLFQGHERFKKHSGSCSWWDKENCVYIRSGTVKRLIYTASVVAASPLQVLRHNGVVSIACGVVGGDTNLSTMPYSMQVLISQITNNNKMYSIQRNLEELLGKVPIVHIEDVCEAPILCMEKPSVIGRFLCASEYLSLAERLPVTGEDITQKSTFLKIKFVEDAGTEIAWGSTTLKEIRFQYRFDAKMTLDESDKCAKKLDEFLSPK